MYRITNDWYTSIERHAFLFEISVLLFFWKIIARAGVWPSDDEFCPWHPLRMKSPGIHDVGFGRVACSRCIFLIHTRILLAMIPYNRGKLSQRPTLLWDANSPPYLPSSPTSQLIATTDRQTSREREREKKTSLLQNDEKNFHLNKFCFAESTRLVDP